MRICLFEDRRTDGLEPLTATRPAFELLCGITSLEEKQQRYFGTGGVGYVVRPLMVDLVREKRPHVPVNDPVWLRAGPVAIVNSRWLPPAGRGTVESRVPISRNESFVATCRGDFAYAAVTSDLLPGASPLALDDVLDDWIGMLPQVEVGGMVARYPWDLVEQNGRYLCADFDALCDPTEVGFHPSHFSLIGPADRLYIDPTAVVEPQVVADTTNGPVVIGPHAMVSAFTRLEGPCTIGRGSRVFGAKIRANTSVGPHCRVGGEVESSILLGYSNKYHEGFLGHSYVGEWVNIAAGTYTADLQFDYSTCTVRIRDHRIATGLTKVGTFFGDHSKTGIGVLLNCGSVMGPFATALPLGRLSPREIPAFTRSGPDGIVPVGDRDSLIATADTVMRRRGLSLTKPMELLYRSLAEESEAAIRVA